MNIDCGHAVRHQFPATCGHDHVKTKSAACGRERRVGHHSRHEQLPGTATGTASPSDGYAHDAHLRRRSPSSSVSADYMNYPATCAPHEPRAPVDSPGGPGGLYTACRPLVSKRSASHELNNPGGRQSPRLEESPRRTVSSLAAARCRAQRRPCHSRESSYDYNQSSVSNLRQTSLPHENQGNYVAVPRDQCDSGYATRRGTGLGPVPTNTSQPPGEDSIPSTESAAINTQCSVPKHWRRPRNVSADGQILAMVLQPDSSPISTEQLAAEVKGIYAGLVMVEAKCINIAAQISNSKTPLGSEQWQNLIALHRTLLYEHHDFLMDYMLAFIYLAYQMMALLFETIPSFTDTWIECLGDLARYRMAIEEEKEAHAAWGGVAARWYTMASDRHPAIGRLYHHLGILERPSLRKFCFYSKSLTCVTPFTNARDSLSTLCGPIVHDEQTIHSSRQSPEARIVTRHALVASHRDLVTIDQVGRDSLQLLGEQMSKLREFGAYFASTNVATLFQLGDQQNDLWKLYSTVLKQEPNGSDPSMVPAQQDDFPTTTNIQDSGDDPHLQSNKAYFASSFNSVLTQYTSTAHLKDALSFVHVNLVFLHSLHALRKRLGQGSQNTYTIPFDFGGLDFAALAAFLSTLALQDPITARMLECARQGVFLEHDNMKPLSEDFVIRGHIWSQFYFSPGLFDGWGEDDGRSIESPSTMKARGARVLWLGLFLAFQTEHLCYDVQSQVFSATTHSPIPSEPVKASARPGEADLTAPAADSASLVVATSPNETTTTTTSSQSSEDGFTMVKRPGKKTASRRGSHSEAKAGAGAKKIIGPGKIQSKRADTSGFQVVGENGELSMQGESLEFQEQHGIRRGYSARR